MKKVIYPFLLILVLVLSACGAAAPKSGTPIQEFQYTDQDEKPLSLSDLKGKVWVANMIFTNCTTVCPPMTANMSQLQSDVKKAGLKDVHFVSFSIDPELDTPEALKKYGESFAADFSTWHFLTGYTQKEAETYLPKNFKTIVKKPNNDDQVIHGTSFYLLNKNGEIIAEYDGKEDVPYKQIVKDIKAASKQ